MPENRQVKIYRNTRCGYDGVCDFHGHFDGFAHTPTEALLEWIETNGYQRVIGPYRGVPAIRTERR